MARRPAPVRGDPAGTGWTPHVDDGGERHGHAEQHPVARCLHPGAAGRLAPIEGVGTAIAAFVGITADGPYDQAIKVANWGQYTATFGTRVQGAYLPNAVYQYFNNGGGSAYITRIGSLSSDEGARASAELTSSLKAGQGVYRIEAKEPGGAGDTITVTVEPKHEQEPPPEGEQAPPAEEESSRSSCSVVTPSSGTRG